MSEAAWQLGYPLELLSEIASLFAQHDEPYALGAFARVKEAQVASWAEAGHLFVARDPNGRAVAAAAAFRASQRRRVEDFSGRAILAQRPGDLLVRRIAHLPGWGAAAVGLLRHMEDRPQARIVLDLWQESQADRAIAAGVGARWQGTKIRASSESTTASSSYATTS